jgi:hypothetical protein
MLLEKFFEAEDEWNDDLTRDATAVGCAKQPAALLRSYRTTRMLQQKVKCKGQVIWSLRMSLRCSGTYTVRLESRCALRIRYVDLVVSIAVAVEVCCCFTVFSC